MDRLPNPTWLRTFEAAARYLNFTEAARELGLTQTAVSLHIRSLEADLGERLFSRAARRLGLTELGQSYALTVRRALADIALSTNSLFGPATRQTLRIRAPISTATYWIATELPAFAAAYPDIPVRLVSNIWGDGPENEDVDLDIRLGHGDWPGLLAEKLCDETIVPIGRADGPHLSPEALRAAPQIHILGYEDNWARWFEAQGLPPAERAALFSVDTTVSAIQLVLAGAGYATILTRFARNAISQGMPLRLAGEPIPFSQSHYLIRPPRAAASPARAQLFLSWLRTRAGADAAG
ncbi:LysR substrate-binding domain-containing protein [Ruegeria sp. PrR005]|uniref:LysR family transcriptional regulator n=1 Tax=Ruegeria sp. PrR005 TaxID=2706882 RepID=A0A6B2NWY0_9RHOB|nr:LysR substrate-binding domain-containing protein [Ruegeria sp. PrR005]NDW46914.1 LysR family transcriptional regulator [Ruegeria sp. PrR005]